MTTSELKRQLAARRQRQARQIKPEPAQHVAPRRPINRSLVVVLVVLAIAIWGGIGAYVYHHNRLIVEGLEYQRQVDSWMNIACRMRALDAGLPMTESQCLRAVRTLRAEEPAIIAECVPPNMLAWVDGPIESIADMSDCISTTPRNDGSLWRWTNHR